MALQCVVHELKYGALAQVIHATRIRATQIVDADIGIQYQMVGNAELRKYLYAHCTLINEIQLNIDPSQYIFIYKGILVPGHNRCVNKYRNTKNRNHMCYIT